MLETDDWKMLRPLAPARSKGPIAVIGGWAAGVLIETVTVSITVDINVVVFSGAAAVTAKVGSSLCCSCC